MADNGYVSVWEQKLSDGCMVSLVLEVQNGANVLFMQCGSATNGTASWGMKEA